MSRTDIEVGQDVLAAVRHARKEALALLSTHSGSSLILRMAGRTLRHADEDERLVSFLLFTVRRRSLRQKLLLSLCRRYGVEPW